jgi:hypothetical protein
MISDNSPFPDAEPMPSQNGYARFFLVFFNLLQTTENLLISFVLLVAALVGLVAGSFRLFSIALAALMVKLYPLLVLAFIAVAAVWAFKFFDRR